MGPPQAASVEGWCPRTEGQKQGLCLADLPLHESEGVFIPHSALRELCRGG